MIKIFIISGTLFLAAAVLFGTGYFKSAEDNGLVAMVSISDDKFEPETLTVQKGTKVIFKNVGDNLHWPASNFHPTHSLYPDKGGCIDSKFDACRGLEKGEVFEYVLNEVGKWPIHDHLFPGLIMVIEVKNDLTEDAVLEDFNYSDQLALIKKMAQDDPAKAWLYLKEKFIIDGQVVGNAHEFAHIIGNSTYSKYGLDGIKNCDASFAYGCYHGVSEKLLQEKGTAAIKDVQYQCVKIFPPQETNNYTGCIHGMGHGLLTWENLNVAEALKGCDSLDSQYRPFCYDGVFMENASASTAKFDVDNPWKFCDDLPGEYHYNCARYQSQVFLNKFGKDILRISQNCVKTDSRILKEACLESTGYYVSQTVKGIPEDIKRLCSQASDREGVSTCIIGAAREIIFQKYQNWDTTPDKLCKELNDEWVNKCLESNQRTRGIYKNNV